MSTNEVLEAQLYKHEGKLESLELRIADLEWAQRPKAWTHARVLASGIVERLERLNLISRQQAPFFFDVINSMLERHADG